MKAKWMGEYDDFQEWWDDMMDELIEEGIVCGDGPNMFINTWHAPGNAYHVSWRSMRFDLGSWVFEANLN